MCLSFRICIILLYKSYCNMPIERRRYSCAWGIGHIWMICCIETSVNIEHLHSPCDIWWLFKRTKYSNLSWLVLVYEVITGINMARSYLCARQLDMQNVFSSQNLKFKIIACVNIEFTTFLYGLKSYIWVFDLPAWPYTVIFPET